MTAPDAELQEARLSRQLAATVAPGVVVYLDGVPYDVVVRHRASLTLHGPRGGKVTLLEPRLGLGLTIWIAWHGGIGAKNAKPRRYRRAGDGTFSAVAS